jgi:hypothetical protein
VKRLCATVCVLGVLVPLAGCGGAEQHRAGVSVAPPKVARELMQQRLRAKSLDYTWLACIALRRTYEHVAITRCNVGFGIDPHVEAYCVVLKNGRLATNHEDLSIPCRHDNAGSNKTTITTS